MLSKIIARSRSSQITLRQFSTLKKVEVEPLPYELSALEPVISGHLMDVHYNKHHKTYCKNLNDKSEEAQEALSKGDHKKLVKLTQAIKFNGGGHYNHSFFWESLAPAKSGGGVLPDQGSDLGKLVTSQWGSFDKFIEQFNSSTAGVQGSGWGWLTYNKDTKVLEYR